MVLIISDGIIVPNTRIILAQNPKTAISVFITAYKYSEDSQNTADGSTIRAGVVWCAVSPDMINKYNLSFGDTIFYNDVGYAIHDLTNDRLRNTVDILIHDNNAFSEYSIIYINNSPHGN
jgi:hypothetical protein